MPTISTSSLRSSLLALVYSIPIIPKLSPTPISSLSLLSYTHTKLHSVQLFHPRADNTTEPGDCHQCSNYETIAKYTPPHIQWMRFYVSVCAIDSFVSHELRSGPKLCLNRESWSIFSGGK